MYTPVLHVRTTARTTTMLWLIVCLVLSPAGTAYTTTTTGRRALSAAERMTEILDAKSNEEWTKTEEGRRALTSTAYPYAMGKHAS